MERGVKLSPTKSEAAASSAVQHRASEFLEAVRQKIARMPLFGKKDSNKKMKKDGKDDRSPSVEDKYTLKELLGT